MMEDKIDGRTLRKTNPKKARKELFTQQEWESMTSQHRHYYREHRPDLLVNVKDKILETNQKQLRELEKNKEKASIDYDKIVELMKYEDMKPVIYKILDRYKILRTERYNSMLTTIEDVMGDTIDNLKFSRTRPKPIETEEPILSNTVSLVEYGIQDKLMEETKKLIEDKKWLNLEVSGLNKSNQHLKIKVKNLKSQIKILTEGNTKLKVDIKDKICKLLDEELVI